MNEPILPRSYYVHPCANCNEPNAPFGQEVKIDGVKQKIWHCAKCKDEAWVAKRSQA